MSALAGRLRQRVTVLEARETTDPAGQPAVAWAKTHRKLPAWRQAVAGGETQRGQKVEANVSAVFVGRFVDLQVIAPTHRIECDGVAYNVEASFDPDGKRDQWEVHCSAVVDG